MITVFRDIFLLSALFDLPEMVSDRRPDAPKTLQAACFADQSCPQEHYRERVALWLSLGFRLRALSS